MHYRSQLQFLIGLPMPPFIVVCLTFNSELMRLPYIARGHVLAVGGNVFTGRLACLICIN
jgi:hypothetical protein